MLTPGPTELVIILLIVVVIFGAAKLPKIGKGLGEGITNFRKAVKKDEIDVTPEEEETPPEVEDDSDAAEKK